MILPYLARLACLCFASFFVLNTALSLLVRISSKFAIRFAESKTPRVAARFLFILRILPFVLATLFVILLCVPSYLWLEPASTAESIGMVCVILALFGAVSWLGAITRSIFSLLASVRHNRLCRFAGQETRMLGQASSVVILESEAPVLALSGLFRPRLLISRGVLRALSAEELSAALSHEHAHRLSRDNAKRLLLLLAPDLLPFVRPFRELERNWSRFAEWAADDRATQGDSHRAVSLAAALVQVARLGSGPRLPFLSTSFLDGDREFSARVDRLLHAAPKPSVRHRWEAQPLLCSAGFLIAAGLGAFLFGSATLSFTHELLELFAH